MTKKLGMLVLVGAIAGQALVAGQGRDAVQVLADARAALGGDAKLDAVKTLTASGRTLKTSPGGTSAESDFEMALELPDHFMRRDAIANMGTMSIYRISGFNGDGVINEVDTPPQLSTGGVNVVIRTAGPGGVSGQPQTPEQQEAARKAMLLSNKQEFARLAIGMFMKSLAAYPLTMTYAGEAESPDGKAEVLDLKGEGDFAARLFLDARTHLPLMLTWMAKEPLQVIRRAGPGGSSVAVSAGGTASFGQANPPSQAPPAANAAPTPPAAAGTSNGQAATPPPPASLEQQVREAEAKRRIVEYRLFYADYQPVNGILLPHRLQRSVDGKPTEELTLEKIKINPKVDAKTFTVSK